MFIKLSSDITDFIKLLQKHEVEFLICGGHAVAFHGFPRMTMDVDILVKPEENNSLKLQLALNDFGFGNIEELSPDKFQQRGTVVSLGVQPNQLDLLTSVSTQDESEIFSHKVSGQFADFTLDFLSYEDLIRAKKEAGRLKDLLDIEELEKIKAKEN